MGRISVQFSSIFQWYYLTCHRHANEVTHEPLCGAAVLSARVQGSPTPPPAHRLMLTRSIRALKGGETGDGSNQSMTRESSPPQVKQFIKLFSHFAHALQPGLSWNWKQSKLKSFLLLCLLKKQFSFFCTVVILMLCVTIISIITSTQFSFFFAKWACSLLPQTFCDEWQVHCSESFYAWTHGYTLPYTPIYTEKSIPSWYFLISRISKSLDL